MKYLWEGLEDIFSVHNVKEKLFSLHRKKLNISALSIDRSIFEYRYEQNQTEQQ